MCEERIILLLESLAGVPTSLVFSGGPKHSAPGFRWAPRSFLQRTTGERSTTIQSGKLATVLPSRGGLLCNMDAIVLSPAFSNNVVANESELLVIKQGVLSSGPILVADPPNEAYHRKRIVIDPPSVRGSELGCLLVLLFSDLISSSVDTVVMLGIVRTADGNSSLGAELQKGILEPGATYVTLGYRWRRKRG